jgi:hypothetical protein
MTGRSLHDALLRVLCEAPLRAALRDDREAAARALGVEEAASLASADPRRLSRLALFMARHFYRERLVRLFRHARAVLARRGRDVLGVLDEPEMRAILDGATLGGAATAGEIATRIEERCRREAAAIVVPADAAAPYFEDLLRYGGALFRVEAGPRRWGDAGGAGELGDGPPRLSPSARILELEFDLPPILDAVEDASRPLPEAARAPTRLLAALDPRGTVNVVRLPDGVARLLSHLDGAVPLETAASRAGLTVDQARGVVGQLRALSAVVF